MRFRVLWLRVAIDALAQAYTQAAGEDRATEVTTDMALADQVLAVNPQHVGESRAGNERIFFLPTLALTYEVFDDEKLVVVISARYRP